MKEPAPIFLERRGYRLRRAMDAARLLPIFGLFAWILPLLWGEGTSRIGVIYVFGVWVALIVISAILSRFLSNAQAANPEDDGGGSL